jgi:hypothetical protein
MTDVLLFWRDYKKNWLEQLGGERPYYWHSKARMLIHLEPGDRLWLVTSGASFGHEAGRAGFLVAIWTLEDVFQNPGDDPLYSREAYPFRVTADPAGSVVFEEPVLVDDVLRPAGRDKTVPIGRFLQGPRRIKEERLRLLLAAANPDPARLARLGIG